MFLSWVLALGLCPVPVKRLLFCLQQIPGLAIPTRRPLGASAVGVARGVSPPSGRENHHSAHFSAATTAMAFFLRANMICAHDAVPATARSIESTESDRQGEGQHCEI
jgi:hypothetical protein